MTERSASVPPRALHLVHGADALRVRLQAAELARALALGETPRTDLAAVPRDALADAPLGVTRLPGREATAGALLMATASAGLFAAADERKVVLVEDAETMDPEALGGVGADAALVLRANGSAAALAKVVRALGGTVHDEGALEPGQAEQWIARRAKTLGVRVEPAAARALADSVAGDLERADHEIEKLGAYAGDAAVSAKDVALLVSGAVEQDVFELTRAVVHHDVRRAVAVLERLLDSGEPPLRLHGLLVWQFRLLLVAAGLRSEADLERAIKQTGLSRGALGTWRREAAGVKVATIRAAYESLYAADLAMKTSVDARSVFQLLVLDLCGVEGADLGPLAERPPG